jgi:hypothetical protein
MSTSVSEELNGYVNDFRNLFKGKQKSKPAFPIIEYTYSKKASLLTRNEWYFYRALREVVGEKYAILTRVPLAAFLMIEAINDEAYKEAMRKIHTQTLDFLLCEPLSMQPKLGIEMEENNGYEPKRQLRIEELERIFNEAELPLLLVPVSKEYDLYVLRDTLIEMLSNNNGNDWEYTPG